jgi:hypothetical protein
MQRSTLALVAGALAVNTFGLAACSATAQRDDSAAGSEQGLASSVHVLTSRNDPARTGANLAEKVLTTSNVGGQTFGHVFTRNVDGQVYAQLLYVGGVNGKNLVYVATEHNSVYAFDADDLRTTAPPVWQKSFGPSVPSADTGCGLLTPEIGITSTPVIDIVARTMWFTAKTKESGAYIHRLHAIDIATGVERPNSPVVVTASAPGSGAGSVGGVITMDPLRHMNRPGLLKAGNAIYLGFASNCDIGPYHGWVLGYDATTLAQTAVHVDTPDGSEGGIWHGGVGLNADENGDVFYVSGNGTFDGVSNFGNSVVRLHPEASANPASGLSVASFFTPFDSSDANDGDLDLGSTGGMLIPGTQLLVTGDKRGLGFLVNKNQLGGFVDQDSQIVQRFQGSTRGMFGGAAFYKHGAGGSYFLWGTGDRLKSFAFDGTQLVLPPQVNTTSLIGYPGGQLSVSADGETAGTAVLWTVRSKRTSAGLAQSAGAGVLQAFDANDVTSELWSSDARASDMLGSIAKFAPPTVANGRVFVGTASNQLVVYGLFAGNPAPGVSVPDAGPDAGTDAGSGSTSDAEGGADAQPDATTSSGSAPTWSQIYALYIGPGTPGHCSGTGGCHTTSHGGFTCGTSKSACFQGLVSAGLVTPADGAASPIGAVGQSPLVWLGGGMPLDSAAPNPAAAAAVQAWVAAGALDD